MNIRQALKRKNKLTSEIKEVQNLIKEYNSRIVDTPVRFDVKELLEKELQQKLDELVSLKVKIHLANAPMYYKIFRISELKSQIAFLRSIPTGEGKVPVSRYDSTTNEKIATYSAADIREKIKALENEIDQIQEELDLYNTVTKLS